MSQTARSSILRSSMLFFLFLLPLLWPHAMFIQLFNHSISSHPQLNVSKEPLISCHRSARRPLSMQATRACKAVAGNLPRYLQDTMDFSPYEQDRLYRTPITRDKGTDCQLDVELMEGILTERSSWYEIANAAWDVIWVCLEAEKMLGHAVVGEEHGMRVRFEHFGG